MRNIAYDPRSRSPTPNSPEYKKALYLAPDLAVEVVSPSQSRAALAAKARLFLAYGTRLVWVILPKQRKIDVFRPGDSDPSSTLGNGDTLDGENVVPAFRYPVANLFR